MSTCPTCREWRWESHRCPPAWRVWSLDNETEEGGGGCVTIYAMTPAEAVEKWAEDDDVASADYGIVGGDTPLVGVRSLVPGAQAFYFWARGESGPQYHTTAATLERLKRELVSLVRQHRFRDAGRLYCRMHEMEHS